MRQKLRCRMIGWIAENDVTRTCMDAFANALSSEQNSEPATQTKIPLAVLKAYPEMLASAAAFAHPGLYNTSTTEWAGLSAPTRYVLVGTFKLNANRVLLWKLCCTSVVPCAQTYLCSVTCPAWLACSCIARPRRDAQR